MIWKRIILIVDYEHAVIWLKCAGDLQTSEWISFLRNALKIAAHTIVLQIKPFNALHVGNFSDITVARASRTYFCRRLLLVHFQQFSNLFSVPYVMSRSILEGCNPHNYQHHTDREGLFLNGCSLLTFGETCNIMWTVYETRIEK
jgi:hypothetical protein